MRCGIKNISSSSQQEIKEAPSSQWKAKALAITLFVMALLAVGIGAGVFQTGQWAYLCYGTGGAFLVADLVWIAVAICRRQPLQEQTSPEVTAKTPSLEEEIQSPIKEETPIEEPKRSSHSEETPIQIDKTEAEELIKTLNTLSSDSVNPPKPRSFQDDLDEKKQAICQQIDTLPIPNVFSESDPKNYSKKELKQDIEVIIKSYDCSIEASQKGLIAHLNAYQEGLSHHFSDSPNPAFPLTGIVKPHANNGYVQVGLQILVHTHFFDFLLYRPLRRKNVALSFFQAEKKPNSPRTKMDLDFNRGIEGFTGGKNTESSEKPFESAEKKPNSPHKSNSYKDPKSSIEGARAKLKNLVLNLREGNAPVKEDIENLVKKVNRLVTFEEHRKEETSGTAQDLLKLLHFFAAEEYHFTLKICSLDKMRQVDSATIFVHTDKRTQSMGVYVKTNGKWFNIVNEQVTEIDLKTVDLSQKTLQEVTFSRAKPVK